MSQLRYETLTTYAAGPPALSIVPGWPRPLGAGVLGEQAPLDQELVLRARVPESSDVLTLVLEPSRPGGFSFSPGQFVTLAVDVDGVPVERCYTISSPPTRPHLLRITVKRTEGGVLSAFLHDRLAIGDRVGVRGPAGLFSVTEHPASRYLLLSAGSGITPTLSTLRTMADLGELDGPGGHDVVVVHSARTPADRVCAAELDALAETHEALRVVWVCEDDDPGAADTPAAWTGPRGRLDAALLAEVAPDLTDREVLTCGPPGYMAAARTLLATLGANPARCHEESFDLGTVGAPVLAVAPETVSSGSAGANAGPTVRFGRSGTEVVCPPGTTVLQAAALAGVTIPSSCGTGLCGTCKSGLLAGRVEMNHLGGIRPREIAQDKFLPCCSTPDGDIVVDV